MKISAKQYARALYELTAGKKTGEVKAVIEKMAGIIYKNGDASKFRDIAGNFRRIFNKNENMVEAEITSSSALSKDSLNSLVGYIKKAAGAEKLETAETIDKEIMGGVILRYGDKVMDASIKRKIEELKNNLIK